MEFNQIPMYEYDWNWKTIPCNLNNEHRLAVDACGYTDRVS